MFFLVILVVLLASCFLAEKPQVGRNCDSECFVISIPVSLNFATILPILGGKLDLFSSSVIQTGTSDHDICTASGWADLRQDVLHVHVIIPEVDRLPGELLTVKSHIDGILKEFRVKIVKLWDLGDNLTVLKIAFCSNPVVCFIDRAMTASNFGATSLRSVTACRDLVFSSLDGDLLICTAYLGI